MIELLANYSNMLGIIGVLLVLSAYFLLNINRLSAMSIRYLALNGLGSALILISLMFHWNLASVVIEAAWIIISLLGFYRILKNKNIG